MFEDATFESTGTIRTHSRDWMLATLCLNGSVLLGLILLPLIYPEAIPSQMTHVLVYAPPPPSAPPALPQLMEQVARSAPSMSALQINVPRVIPIGVGHDANPPQAVSAISNGSEFPFSSGIPGGVSGFSRNNAPTVLPPPKPTSPSLISSTLAQGLLLQQVIPIYPPMARAARIEGCVVLKATISKAGTIEKLSVMSGPVMLRQAALDAVRSWRYRPFLLNGSPVDVETTVNVVFRLGQQ